MTNINIINDFIVNEDGCWPYKSKYNNQRSQMYIIYRDTNELPDYDCSKISRKLRGFFKVYSDIKHSRVNLKTVRYDKY
jgi:hypothetical protein